MNRRNLGTSSGRREKAVDKSAMERMVRQNRARRKKRRKDKSISLAATMSKNVIALATSLHGIGPLIQNGTFRKRVAEIEPPWHPPRGFSLVPIEMPDFSMELLLHRPRLRGCAQSETRPYAHLVRYIIEYSRQADRLDRHGRPPDSSFPYFSAYYSG